MAWLSFPFLYPEPLIFLHFYWPNVLFYELYLASTYFMNNRFKKSSFVRIFILIYMLWSHQYNSSIPDTPTLPPRSRLQQYMNYMNSSNIHQRLPSPLKDPFGPLVRKKILYMAKFGGYGEGRGEFTEPSGVCVHPVTDDIIIADTNNHRLQVSSILLISD